MLLIKLKKAFYFMSINPIKSLFSQFQQLTSNPKDLSIEKALLEPLQKIIESSGKENASLEKLYVSLEHLKGRTLEALEPENFTTIYTAFLTALSETSGSSYTIGDLCSVEQLQANFLLFQNAISRVSVKALKDVFENAQIDGQPGNLRLTLSETAFRSEDIKETTESTQSIGEEELPELFILDNVERKFKEMRDEKGQALITEQDALDLNEKLVQLVDSCKYIRLEDKDLFRKVLLLCRTQYIYSSFSTSSKMLLTILLDLFSAPDYAIETSGKVKFVVENDGVRVTFDYKHQIMPKPLQEHGISLQEWNEFCQENNLPNNVGLDGHVEFVVSIKDGEVEFKNQEHTAHLHASIDPNSIVSKALNLEDVSELTTTIEPLKSKVTHPSKKQIELLLSSLLPFEQTMHPIDLAQCAIPESFEDAYLKGGEIPPTTVVIGGARLVNVTDKDSAEQVILNVEELAKSLTKDPKLQEAITLQILNLCSQKVLKSLNTAQKDLIAPNLDFQSNTTIRFESVKGFFGGIKDDAIRCKISTDLITYPKGDLTKLTPEEKSQYRPCLEMLGCAVSTTAETSFVLEFNINLGGKISCELKEILHKVTVK